MKKSIFVVIPVLLASALILGIVENVEAALDSIADTSQQFSVDKLPQEIAINLMALEKDTADTQPRLKYLKFTGLKVAEDGKTVHFNIENSFALPDAKPILLGGLMLSGMVRYDYDEGAKLHSSVLLQDRRIVLDQGINTFKTNPQTYPNVTKIEKLQIHIIPPKTDLIKSKANMVKDLVDTSQSFPVDNLPQLIAIDRHTISQNASLRDPRLEYLKISGLKVAADGKTVEFAIENSFNRQKNVPIHVGALMLTAMARYDYDNGAELHNSVLFSQRRVKFDNGSTIFTTDPELYPHVTKLESLQFFFTTK